MKRIAARLSGRHGPTCETGDDTVAVGDPVLGAGQRLTARPERGARSAPVASGLQFAGSAGVRRNPAYAASSDRQAA